MTQVFKLANIPYQLLPQIGGKARGLHQLLQLGFNVPAAFIVTNIDTTQLEEAVAMYQKLNFKKVSVRSSATLEDGNDFSAAGQYSTYLNVEGPEALKEAICNCVASLNNDTATQYNKTFLSAAQAKMTVVVQEMVDARYAGVIFTQAPHSPGDVLIEAVHGLGENLVSGKVSAEQYLANESRLTLPDNAMLSRELVQALFLGGRKAEKAFDKPMDLEWAIDKNARIKWLQARPITLEQSVTINEFDYKPDVSNSVMTTSNIGECMPGAVTPLNISTNMFALDWGIRKTMSKIGCIRRTNSLPAFACIAPFYNHMFFNMSNTYLICHSIFGSTKPTMDMAICGRVLEGYPDIKTSYIPAYRRFFNTLRFMRYIISAEPAKKGMDKVVARLHFNLEAPSKELYKQILDNFVHLRHSQYFHYCTSYYSGGQNNILTMFVENDFKDRNEMQSKLAGCLAGIQNFESANVLQMMRNLAKLMVEDKSEVVEYSVEQLIHYIKNEASAKVLEEYKKFMQRHGHRGIREPEIRCLSWRDNPESFFSSMRSVLLTNNEQKPAAAPSKSWRAYAQELLYNHKGWKYNYLMGCVKKARKGVYYREYTKAKTIYVLDQFKQAYYRLGQNMAAEGLLPDYDCIYFLTQEEVGKVLSGNNSLVKKAIARRRLYDEQMDLKFAEVCLGKPQPKPAREANPDSTSFKGTPASRGIAKGYARIVRNERDAAQLKNGEIMVAACTDVGWTPYYNIISGLVTEIGSALSHGIVVAREYALPSVVNVDNIMQEIKTGDQLIVDGNEGMVYIEKRAE